MSKHLEEKDVLISIQ